MEEYVAQDGMTERCEGVARRLTLGACEYLFSMKLLPEAPDSVLSDILQDTNDVKKAKVALLTKWCNEQPEEASMERLHQYLLEMQDADFNVQDAIRFLKKLHDNRMAEMCEGVAKRLNIDACEYLFSMKLLPDEPDLVLSDIRRDTNDVDEAKVALLTKWCNEKPEEASMETLHQYLREMQGAHLNVLDAIRFLERQHDNQTPVANIDNRTPTTPPNLSITFQTATTACVSWEEPADSGDSPLTGYLLELKFLKNQPWETIYTNGLQKECTVRNLKEGQNYLFRVAAVNYHEYISDFNQIKDPVRLEICMPSTPRNVSAVYLEDQCVGLNWETPEYDGGSSISGYQLDIHDCSDVITTHDLPAEALQYRIQNPSPAPYVYYVCAVNKTGQNSYAKCAVLKATKLTVADATKTSMTFKWKKPETKRATMGISRYIFDILGENGFRVTHKLPRHQNEFTAANLVEGRWYEFRLAAEYSGGCSSFVKFDIAVPLKPVQAREVHDVTLTCELVQSDVTDGEWLFDGGPLQSNDRVHISTERCTQFMKIHQVEQSDYGVYTFHAGAVSTAALLKADTADTQFIDRLIQQLKPPHTQAALQGLKAFIFDNYGYISNNCEVVSDGLAERDVGPLVFDFIQHVQKSNPKLDRLDLDTTCWLYTVLGWFTDKSVPLQHILVKARFPLLVAQHLNLLHEHYQQDEKVHEVVSYGIGLINNCSNEPSLAPAVRQQVAQLLVVYQDVIPTQLQHVLNLSDIV